MSNMGHMLCHKDTMRQRRENLRLTQVKNEDTQDGIGEEFIERGGYRWVFICPLLNWCNETRGH